MDLRLFALIITLPIVSIWITWITVNYSGFQQTEINFPGQANAKKISDTFFNETKIVNFGENGTPTSKIIGQQLYHYPGEEDSEIIQPEITLFREDGAPIFVTAHKGWINESGSRVKLKGQAVIRREPSATNRFSKLEAPELIIWPQKKYIETDTKVEITTDTTFIIGEGMQADLANSHYIFLNRVKGTHYPVNR